MSSDNNLSYRDFFLKYQISRKGDKITFSQKKHILESVKPISNGKINNKQMQ